MSTTEASAIDEKKAEESGTTTDKADWKGFTTVFSSSLITGIFFGVVVLFYKTETTPALFLC
jgi:hypothetical protein